MSDQALISEYERGGDLLKSAVAGLTRADLLAKPVPGKWSTQQVILHLQDAEFAFADRVRRIIAEDHPTVMAWDENRYVERLSYDEQSVEDAVAIVDLTRRQLARMLKSLPENVLNRAGAHNQAGEITARVCLEKANWHLKHHLRFVYEKRERLGKPLAPSGGAT